MRPLLSGNGCFGRAPYAALVVVVMHADVEQPRHRDEYAVKITMATAAM
jgi:hypothetical protein